MTVRTRSLVAGFGLALLAAGVLTACATPAGSGSTPAPSSSSSTGGDDSEISAAWLDNGSTIGLVTLGSSTCVPVAGDVSYDKGVLTVELVEPDEDAACTKDFVPRVTLVGVPEGVDPADELEITVSGAGVTGDTDLDGVADLPATEEYAPSAGWTGEDGQLVILTWGSSGCPPVVENVEATGASEVTVTFATPPANQVCTMDMAPRGTVAVVEGLEEDSGAVAILTGAEFADVKVPIAGTD
ncbi:hypothetical protein R8Z57_12785 [Microbacterium sp. M3]|uniref:Lipoprotein n=1 Tax=Microbacterium arthrosphaerae TaxID=792652 RepID=A0ABU4H6Z5_9MICO|nr:MULTISPECIES: hypothetical protein [Microbacterium]MDW4573649.1 hypothetical protein [Microbacterium arthrosphaerae]MDW7607504.1 hypothetical protein [Microbacterium sp. M3]